MKQVMVHFDFPNTTQKQYNGVWDGLKASGHAHPKGLLFHVAAPKDKGGLMVTDVWESENAFREFSKILLPIIAKQDIPQVQPTISPAYNVYEGKAVSAH